MKTIYNLTNDYLFKQIFRIEKYLKHLLFNMFNVKCKYVKYLNTEIIKDNFTQKAELVDILLEVDGEIVILELQNIDRQNFKDRIVYYSSNIISKYCLKRGQDYVKIKPIKVYAIINYQGFNNEVLDIIKLKNKTEIFTEKLEYKIFDLTKAKEDNELVKLFKTNDLNNLTKETKNKINKEILEKIKHFNLDERKYKKMEDIVKMMMEEEEHYETAYDNGKIKGKLEGELKKQNEIARNLLKENIDINIIAKTTGLTSNQILSLK